MDAHRGGKELHEVIRGDVLLMHPKVDVDYEAGELGSIFGLIVKNDEDLETIFKVFDAIEYPMDLDKCFQVDHVSGEVLDKSDDESLFLPMEEIMFEEHQSCRQATQIKERTARRHDTVIFAIELNLEKLKEVGLTTINERFLEATQVIV